MLRASILGILAFSSLCLAGVIVYSLRNPGVSRLQSVVGAAPPFDFWRKGSDAHFTLASSADRRSRNVIPAFDLLGLSYGRWIVHNRGRAYHALTIPLWMPAIVFGCPPLLALRRVLGSRNRRRRRFESDYGNIQYVR